MRRATLARGIVLLLGSLLTACLPVTPKPLYRLQFVTPLPDTVGIGAAFSPVPVLQVVDSTGAPVLLPGIVVQAMMVDTPVDVTQVGATTFTSDASGRIQLPLALVGPPGTQVELRYLSPAVPPGPDTVTLAWRRRFSVNPIAVVDTGEIPNATWLDAENRMMLIYGAMPGIAVATSTDGRTFTGLGETAPTETFEQAARADDVTPADVLVRLTSGGIRRYFYKGMGRTDTAYIYAADDSGGAALEPLNHGKPVYTGSAAQGTRYEVFDIVATRNPGEWRMFYVVPGVDPGQTRTAISTDEGETWAHDYENPFGDLDVKPSSASTRNVDPAPLRLSDGTYMAVTMRGGPLYFWNSWDAKDFTATGDSVVASDFSGLLTVKANAMLTDPTIVQLPDGTIYLYVAVDTDKGKVIVQAEVIPTP